MTASSSSGSRRRRRRYYVPNGIFRRVPMSRIIRIPGQYTFNPFDIMILGTVNVGIYLMTAFVVVRMAIIIIRRFLKSFILIKKEYNIFDSFKYKHRNNKYKFNNNLELVDADYYYTILEKCMLYINSNNKNYCISNNCNPNNKPFYYHLV